MILMCGTLGCIVLIAIEFKSLQNIVQTWAFIILLVLLSILLVYIMLNWWLHTSILHAICKYSFAKFYIAGIFFGYIKVLFVCLFYHKAQIFQF